MPICPAWVLLFLCGAEIFFARMGDKNKNRGPVSPQNGGLPPPTVFFSQKRGFAVLRLFGALARGLWFFFLHARLEQKGKFPQWLWFRRLYFPPVVTTPQMPKRGFGSGVQFRRFIFRRS